MEKVLEKTTVAWPDPLFSESRDPALSESDGKELLVTMLQTYQARTQMPPNNPLVPLLNKVRVATDYILCVSHSAWILQWWYRGTCG